MGRLAKQILSDIEAMDRGEAAVTESPIGDRGEPRLPAGQPNGRILLRLSRREHAALVREAHEQGVSLNHYLTEIVCGRQHDAATTSRSIRSSQSGNSKQRARPVTRSPRSSQVQQR